MMSDMFAAFDQKSIFENCYGWNIFLKQHEEWNMLEMKMSATTYVSSIKDCSGKMLKDLLLARFI